MAQLNSLLVTGDSRFLNPINGNARNGIYYVKGTQTAATGAWTGVIPIPALYDGLTIMYYLPYAGSGNATLNLTLSNGTTTGAVNCYYGNATRLTTHYSQGSNIVMTYHSAGSISINGTATTDNRWIANADYNTTYSAMSVSELTTGTANSSRTVRADYLKQGIEEIIEDNISNKMDKSNPTGSGSLSLNRKASTTIGTDSVAVGYNTTASGNYSHAEGQGTTASDGCAHAEGSYTQANSACSHAEGYNTKTSGLYAHAEGQASEASGVSTHAEGNGTKAIGNYSHAEGQGTTASGTYSHTEGGGTTASQPCSHAEGGGTTASGANSHAEGGGATASGANSHAEGANTVASGNQTHAEGNGTKANAENAHAEGNTTEASGDYSHAEGDHTIAAGSAQHVSGRYNIADNDNTYAEIVGNGTATNARSNARTLDWQGNETIAGDLTFNGSTSLSDTLDDKTTYKECTQAQYDAWEQAGTLESDVTYYITDAQAGTPLATEIAMSTSDNTSVAEAISVFTVPTGTSKIGDDYTVTPYNLTTNSTLSGSDVNIKYKYVGNYLYLCGRISVNVLTRTGANGGVLIPLKSGKKFSEYGDIFCGISAYSDSPRNGESTILHFESNSTSLRIIASETFANIQPNKRLILYVPPIVLKLSDV